MDEEASNGLEQKPRRALRACNACRQRKIKCNGQPNCKNCLQAELKCVYSSRSSTAKSRQSIIRGGVIATCRDAELQHRFPNSQDWDLSVSDSRAFPVNFFWDLVDDYCKYTLPTVPVIGEDEFRSAIQSLAHSSENASLVYCLAAQTINLARPRTNGLQSTPDDAKTLFEMALRARGPLLTLQQVTVQSVLVSVVASMGMFAEKRDGGMGPYYHLEAIAGLQALRINDEKCQGLLDPKIAAQRQRLYWLLFVHDRFHAIVADRMGILSPLLHPPQPAVDIPSGVIAWFRQITQLFLVVDDDFLRFLKDKDSPYITLNWIEKKQSELSDDAWALQQFTDMQQVDLIITRCWLRTLVWQIALHKFALTSNVQGQDPNFMSLDYPIHLSHQLQHLLSTKPRETVEVHGTGILQKIFEIACTVADLLLHVVPRTCDPEAWSAHLNSFLVLHTFLFRMSKFYDVERNVLAAKLEEVQSVFPGLLYELQVSPAAE